MKKKVTMLQMDIDYGEPDKNFARVEKWIADAAGAGADIILLPEMWNTGYDLTRLGEIADKHAKQSIELLSNLAKEHAITIIGGSVAEQCDDGVRNTMLIINSEGELVHKYSKLHLFQLMDEHLHLEEGTDETHFELNGTSSAGFICYDIRFPEWMRKAAVSGAQIMYVVAEWPKPRIDHWRIVLQARAIENQCYVIACNRSGADPKNEFGGMSLIIDPWGQIVAEGGLHEEIVTGEIDMDLVDEVRKRIPIFQDRRVEKY